MDIRARIVNRLAVKGKILVPIIILIVIFSTVLIPFTHAKMSIHVLVRGGYNEILSIWAIPEFQITWAENPWQFPDTIQEMRRFDVIVLYQNERQSFTDKQLRALKEFVHEGGGFLALGGWLGFGNGGYANTTVEEILPIKIISNYDWNDTVYSGKVETPSHPAIDGVNFQRLSFTGYNKVLAKENTQIICTIKDTSFPLMVTGEYGKGRTMAFMECYVNAPYGSEEWNEARKLFKHILTWLGNFHNMISLKILQIVEVCCILCLIPCLLLLSWNTKSESENKEESNGGMTREILLHIVVLSLLILPLLLMSRNWWGDGEPQLSEIATYFLSGYATVKSGSLLWNTYWLFGVPTLFTGGYLYIFAQLPTIAVMCITRDMYLSIKIVAMFYFLAIGISMYYLMWRKTRSRTIALFSAIIFGYAPIQLEDIYLLGFLEMSLSLSLIPMVFLYFTEMIEKQTNSACIKFALASSVMVLAQPEIALMFCFFLIPYGFFCSGMFYIREGHKQAYLNLRGIANKLLSIRIKFSLLRNFVISGVIILCLISVWLVPYLYYIRLNPQFAQVHFSVSDSLPWSTRWDSAICLSGQGIGFNTYAEALGIWGINGIFLLIPFCLATLATFLTKDKKNIVFFLLTLGIIWLSMGVHAPLFNIYSLARKFIPFLSFTRAPGRFAHIASFLVSYLSGLSCSVLARNLRRPKLYVRTYLAGHVLRINSCTLRRGGIFILTLLVLLSYTQVAQTINFKSYRFPESIEGPYRWISQQCEESRVLMLPVLGQVQWKGFEDNPYGPASSYYRPSPFPPLGWEVPWIHDQLCEKYGIRNLDGHYHAQNSPERIRNLMQILHSRYIDFVTWNTALDFEKFLNNFWDLKYIIVYKAMLPQDALESLRHAYYPSIYETSDILVLERPSALTKHVFLTSAILPVMSGSYLDTLLFLPYIDGFNPAIRPNVFIIDPSRGLNLDMYNLLNSSKILFFHESDIQDFILSYVFLNNNAVKLIRTMDYLNANWFMEDSPYVQPVLDYFGTASWTKDATLTIPFSIGETGRYDLFIRIWTSPEVAKIEASLDGRTTNDLPLNSSKGWRWKQIISSNLTAGNHVLKFTKVTSGYSLLDSVAIIADSDFNAAYTRIMDELNRYTLNGGRLITLTNAENEFKVDDGSYLARCYASFYNSSLHPYSGCSVTVPPNGTCSLRIWVPFDAPYTLSFRVLSRFPENVHPYNRGSLDISIDGSSLGNFTTAEEEPRWYWLNVTTFLTQGYHEVKLKSINGWNDLDALYFNNGNAYDIASTYNSSALILSTAFEYTALNAGHYRIRVHNNTSMQLFLIVSELYFPGWKADLNVDGVKTKMNPFSLDFFVNGFRIVKANNFVVSVYFNLETVPRISIYGSLIIALVLILVLVIRLIAPYLKHKKNTKGQKSIDNRLSDRKRRVSSWKG